MADDRIDGEARAHEERRVRQVGWIRAIAAGGRVMSAALRQLQDAYDDKAIRMCMRDYGLSRADADDVWQDVLIGICKGAPSFRAQDDPLPWILTLIKNRAIDELRKAWRNKRVDHGDAGPPELPTPATQGRPAHFSADDCVRRGLQDYERVHPEGALAIRLRDLDGDDIPQVAARLGRSVEATRSFLTSVRKKLQPFFEDCLELLSAED